MPNRDTSDEWGESAATEAIRTIGEVIHEGANQVTTLINQQGRLIDEMSKQNERTASTLSKAVDALREQTQVGVQTQLETQRQVSVLGQELGKVDGIISRDTPERASLLMRVAGLEAFQRNSFESVKQQRNLGVGTITTIGMAVLTVIAGLIIALINASGGRVHQ